MDDCRALHLRSQAMPYVTCPVSLDNKRVLPILVSLAQQIYTCFLSLSFKSWDLTLCFNNRSYLFRDKLVTVGGALWVGFFSQQCRHFPTSMTSQSLCISLNSLVGKDTCFSFNIINIPTKPPRKIRQLSVPLLSWIWSSMSSRRK